MTIGRYGIPEFARSAEPISQLASQSLQGVPSPNAVLRPAPGIGFTGALGLLLAVLVLIGAVIVMRKARELLR